MIRKIRILIVDDEEYNLLIVSKILELNVDCQFKTVSTGQEALSVIEDFDPDIVLLDVRMPEMDGYEVCRGIRQGAIAQYAKIIMISGLSSIDERLEGYAAGADDYITKPFVKEELLAKIQVYSKLSRMEEVDSMKKTAMGILSHEARTPLNGILMGSELLADLPSLDDDAKKYALLIKDSGTRIKNLVDKISRYCELQDGVQLVLEERAVRGEIRELIGLHSSHPTKAQIDLTANESLSLLSDWELLREAISHLLGNALERNPDGGKIQVVVEETAGGVQISVIDQGKVVSPGFCEKVFEGLYTPDLMHHHRGTGLGLAITKEIASLHGGEVSCQAMEQGGAVFSLYLPNLRTDSLGDA